MFTGDKLFGTWIQRQFPGLSVQALRPSRLQAVYLPTWIVDAEVSANMWFKKQRDDSDSRKYLFLPFEIGGVNIAVLG